MSIFIINPYTAVGGLKFGMTQEQVLTAGYVPVKKTKNRRDEVNWLFDGFSVRFGRDNDQLCEVGLSSSCRALINGVDVFSDSGALLKIFTYDSDVYEFYGFLVFFGLGITLTGFHEDIESSKTLTAFARGYWDQSRAHPSFRKWEPKSPGFDN